MPPSGVGGDRRDYAPRTAYDPAAPENWPGGAPDDVAQALDLLAATVAGLGEAVAVKENDLTVVQAAHGFALHDLVGVGAGGYYAAKADDPDTSDVVGIVVTVENVNTFEVRFFGRVDGLAVDPSTVYFLSATVAGAFTDVAPTDAGHVQKPVLLPLSETSALFVHLRGKIVPAT